MISLAGCDQATLKEEQICMEDSELKDYFAKSQLLTFYYDTKVDYEDIENPLKSVIKRNTIPIDLDTPQAKQLFLKNHEFKDDTKWV